MGGTLHVLTGPTAVGKTELSLRWSEMQPNGAEILSCDSLLVYRGMNIGTAKPTPQAMSRVPHHAIDVVPVDRQYSIAEYVDLAARTVGDVLDRGKKLLVTGGSGFYLKSFFAPVLDPVDVPESVSKAVRTLYRERGLPALVARVRGLNPNGLAGLETRNPRRVIRALERCLASGRELPDLRRQFAAQPDPFGDVEKKVCLLSRSPESLKQRIRERTYQMLRDGLVEEVRRLLDAGIRRNPSAHRSIGYRETIAFLESDGGDEDALARAIISSTVSLVKKQQTWFKKQIPIDRVVDLDACPEDPEPDVLFD